ncbi:39S ribosomal protein L42, mitochondrial [Larimichthys crocea]|uniref:Uncharacterized protein n=1 Tax=Larimichthys crocea TaxID=215358 RepID=A0ACD3Q6R2_LARCR|nr:39S ribosomal protein L42, mitochondrial [Larimichthys crocea]
MRQKSSISGPSLDSSNCNVEIAATSDGKTIVCYHPAADIPYELTQPIERPDPVTNTTETHDQVLKAHLSKEVLRDKPGPTIEELSKMFFTTKHRWYPLRTVPHETQKEGSPKGQIVTKLQMMFVGVTVTMMYNKLLNIKSVVMSF